MSEKPKNFEIPNEDGVVIHEDLVPLQNIEEVEKESGVSEETNYEALQDEGDVIDNEYPQTIEEIEMSGLSLDMKESVEAWIDLSSGDQEVVAEIAEASEATLYDALTKEGKSGNNARVAAVGYDFSTTKSTEDAEEPVSTKGQLKSLLNKLGNGSLKVARHIATAVTLTVAAVSHADNAEARGFMDYVPAIAGVAGAQNPKLGKTIEGGVIRPVERGVQGGQRIERILQQQETLEMRHAKLDREKEELLLRAGGNSRIADVESRVESRTQPAEMEAKYEVGKAQLKTSRAQLRAAYLSNSNPTAVDQARYEEQMAKLNERDVRLDAQYEINAVKGEVRRDTKNMKAEHNVANVYDQIERKNIQQAQIRKQIEKLNMDMAKIRYTTSRDMTRDVLRSF
jgi:hypothetical protein